MLISAMQAAGAIEGKETAPICIYADSLKHTHKIIGEGAFFLVITDIVDDKHHFMYSQ